MYHAILKRVFGAQLRNTAIAGALVAGLPVAAFAHHHNFRVDVVVPAPEVVVPVAPCDAAPAQVSVAPVYRTVTERVWVDPVTTTQIQQVEVPAELGWRKVVFYDYFGRAHIRHEQFEMTPAHVEDRLVQVVLTPGHFEDQTRQELVCDGHFVTPIAQPAVVVQPIAARVEIPLPF